MVTPRKWSYIEKAWIDKKGIPRFKKGKFAGWFVPFGGLFKTKREAMEYIKKEKLKKVI